MARKPRVHYPAALYHVILRGNAGQEIFFGQEDRFRFYLLLQEGIERYGHRIHAFCLMTNHVHLAIQVGEVRLSRIIQNLAFRYTRWVNWHRKRTGHLFQGRYKAILIDADSYLLELTRYIHLNPVRSGVVRKPEDYAWSGHRAFLGLETIPWLTTVWVLSMFSNKGNRARRMYQKFVEEGKEGGYQREYGMGSEMDSRILGDTVFIDKVLGRKQERLKRAVTVEEIVSWVCKEFSLRKDRLLGSRKDRRFSKVRAIAAWLVLDSGNLTLSELSKRVNRDSSTLSTAAKLLEKHAQTDTELRLVMNKMREDLFEIQISKA
jgi:putative transposase